MKKLSQEDVKLLFLQHGCELLGEYEGSRKPVFYRCFCGRNGQISLDKFRRRIRRGEGCIGCNSFVWDDEKDKILKECYGNKSRKEICLLIPGVTFGSLKARAKKLKLSGNKSLSMANAHNFIKTKYSVYKDFFSHKKLISSYWAGFISSRAIISVKKHTISFSLPIEFRSTLEKFQDISCHTGSIKELRNKVVLYFYGVKKWLDDLKGNFGLFSNEKEPFSASFLVKEKYILAFIVGCIDGNGKISKFLNDYKIEIFGKSNLLTWIKLNFDKLIPPLGGEYASMCSYKRNIFSYSIRSVRAKFLIKRLLSVDVPRRSDIWNKFLYLK